MNGLEEISLIDCFYDITYYQTYLFGVIGIIDINWFPLYKSLRFSLVKLFLLLESKAIEALYTFVFLT